jgi:hypothetical protein
MEMTISGLLAIAKKIASGNSVLHRDLAELARAMYKSNLTTAQQKHLGNLINDGLPGKPIAWELRVSEVDVVDSESTAFLIREDVDYLCIDFVTRDKNAALLGRGERIRVNGQILKCYRGDEYLRIVLSNVRANQRLETDRRTSSFGSLASSAQPLRYRRK